MIERLLERYRCGRHSYADKNLRDVDAQQLALAPIAAMISCCDNRLEPTRLFALRPGEVYSILNVANLVPEYFTLGYPCETAAGLQFAVTKLQVPHLAVLGHSNCLGIRRMMDLPDSSEYDNFVDEWVRQAKTACQKLANSDYLDESEARSKAFEQASIRLSLDRLMGYPWICARVESGQLALHGWYYSFKEDQLLSLDPDSQCFNPVG